MLRLKTGDRVKIADREMTAVDVKSGLFYDYFRNLRGAVEHVYEDKTVCVRIDFESLPADVQQRHLEVQEAVRQRWLGSLSQEQRARLSEKDSELTLAYNILVGAADLEVIGRGETEAKSKVSETAKAGQLRPSESRTVKPTAKQERKADRLTQEDIEKAEQEHLKSMAARTKANKR